jgi:curli biogenesis system outer membrane secretion channel CsgG
MLKKISFTFAMTFFVLIFIQNSGFAKTRLSVTTFDNKAAGSDCYCNYYGAHLGEGMADQLITKLSDIGKYEILERATIKDIYQGEHELINADQETAPERNKFRHAQYTIVGAITSFEECAGGVGAGLNVGRLIGIGDMDVKAKTKNAKVIIDMRVIDVKTGEVLKSVKASGTSHKTNVGAEGLVKGVDFGTDAFYKSPIGEATREAISNAADKLAKIIPDLQDSPQVASTSEKKQDSRGTGSAPTGTAVASRERKVDIQTDVVICERKCEHLTMVKLLDESGGGDNINVYDFGEREKKWIKKTELMKIANPQNSQNIKIGSDIYTRLDYNRDAPYSRYYQLRKCVVLDKSSDGQEIIVDCRADEGTKGYSLDRLYVLSK